MENTRNATDTHSSGGARIQRRIGKRIRQRSARSTVCSRRISGLRCLRTQLVLDFVEQPGNVGIGFAETVAFKGGVEIIGVHNVNVDLFGDGHELAVEMSPSLSDGETQRGRSTNFRVIGDEMGLK